jgi:hypothetical protein
MMFAPMAKSVDHERLGGQMQNDSIHPLDHVMEEMGFHKTKLIGTKNVPFESASEPSNDHAEACMGVGYAAASLGISLEDARGMIPPPCRQTEVDLGASVSNPAQPAANRAASAVPASERGFR